MSDSDFKDSQCPGWLDLESSLPHHSLVDSTDNSTLGVNVNTNPNFSANQTQIQATAIGDSNISGPAPNTGISVGPPRGTKSVKGEEFLESPTQTTPRRKSPPFLPFHFGWSMGRGRGMGRAKNSTLS